MKKKIDQWREFGLSSVAVNNRKTVYLIILILLIGGLTGYQNMPRESFPEISDTRVFVSAVFPGNTAEDVERLIVDPLEEALKGVQNLVDITSTSEEDFAVVKLEFDEDIACLLYTSPSPRDRTRSRMPSSA